MPNTSVRAAAEGLPGFPQKADRFGFLRKLTTLLSRARAMTPEQEENIMNIHVNRRSLVAVATVSSVLAFPADFAEAVAPVEPIADHPWVVARDLADRLSEVLDDIDGGAWHADIYPSESGTHSIAFLRRDTYSQLAELIADYRWKVAESDRVDGEFEDAKRKDPNERVTDGGALGKLFNLSDQAGNARADALDAIFAYRPHSLDEYRLRDRFCAEILVEGYEFFDCDLRMVFAAPKESRLPEKRNIAWVERMRDAGYVFVCRGEPDAADLDNWGVRSDTEHGDDTDLLISLLEERARRKAA